MLRRLAPHGHTDHLIAGAGELVDTLARVFDLDLPEAAALWPKIVARHEAVMSGRVPAGPMGPPVPENG